MRPTTWFFIAEADVEWSTSASWSFLYTRRNTHKKKCTRGVPPYPFYPRHHPREKRREDRMFMSPPSPHRQTKRRSWRLSKYSGYAQPAPPVSGIIRPPVVPRRKLARKERKRKTNGRGASDKRGHVRVATETEWSGKEARGGHDVTLLTFLGVGWRYYTERNWVAANY